MHEMSEAWKTHLERDLAGFADRGSAPLVESEGNTLRAAWTVRGRDQSELFGVSPDGSLRWVSGPSGDDAYSDFLASESMADLEQLAAAIARSIPIDPTSSRATRQWRTDYSTDSRCMPPPMR